MVTRKSCGAIGVVAAALVVSPAWPQSTATYTYDSEGRLIGTAYPSGATAAYTYDNGDNRTRVTTTLGSNTPPVAGSDNVNVVAGGSITIDVLTNDSDADGDTLSISSVTSPSLGTASISGTSIVYTSSGSTGIDTFNYAINDGRGGTATAAVTVTIAPACTLPAPQASAATVGYNSINNVLPLTISGASATSVGVVAGPNHGTAFTSGTSIYYTPSSGYVGADSVSYSATNSCGSAAGGSVNVTVQAPAAPTVGNATLTVSQNTPGAVTLPVSGYWSTINIVGGPYAGTYSLSGTTLTYWPNSGYVGGDHVYYNASGPGGTSAGGDLAITVVAPPPVANPDHLVTTVSLGPFWSSWGGCVDVLANDSGSALTITSVSAPSSGFTFAAATISGSQICYSVPFQSPVLDTVTYTISSPYGSAVGTVYIHAPGTWP